MCADCWEDEGRPQIDTPAVREAAKAVEDVYEYACTGGNLHVVLDDWNLEDAHLRFCSAQIDRGGLPDDPNHWYTKAKIEDPDSPEQLAAERKCCDLFMALTMDERASALALHRGLWSIEEVAQRKAR